MNEIQFTKREAYKGSRGIPPTIKNGICGNAQQIYSRENTPHGTLFPNQNPEYTIPVDHIQGIKENREPSGQVQPSLIQLIMGEGSQPELPDIMIIILVILIMILKIILYHTGSTPNKGSHLDE